ncbi:MAG: GMC oxidoreductase, partial [Pseudomonadota bacterium]
GFVRSDASLERPDIQYYFGPVTSNPKTDSFFPAFPGYKLTWCVLRPSAQGSVKLASRDPQHPPKIEHGYLSTAADVAANRAAFRIGRNLLTQPAMRALAGYEDLPGDGVESDDEIDGYVRDHLGTHYHPVGTCRMGGDAGAVVDPRLRVAGIDGLRIVDASVMPNIVGGNTNAPTIMIAEKAADLIREDDR